MAPSFKTTKCNEFSVVFSLAQLKGDEKSADQRHSVYFGT